MECYLEPLTDGSIQARLSGQFIFSDHPKFKAVLESVENSEIKDIRVNLSQVTFIDSAGLGMLLLLRDLCSKENKSLTLCSPQGQVKKVFGICKFEHLFTIEE